MNTNAIKVLTTMMLAGILTGCLSEEDTGLVVSRDDDPIQNTAPTISGNPGNAVMIGDIYTFKPTASDSDGDNLNFTIQNPPQWASFNSTTGEISGQPFLGDEGVYDQIVVTVSDGTSSMDLTAFSITVTQGALGSMTLSWTAPSQNSDGTALTDLAGYRIYYGVTEGNYTNDVTIDSVGMATYVVENLLPDTYYVVATAVNNTGVESAYSNVVEKVVEGS